MAVAAGRRGSALLQLFDTLMALCSKFILSCCSWKELSYCAGAAHEKGSFTDMVTSVEMGSVIWLPA